MIAEINKLELKSCLYFRVTLNSLFLTWISEMTQNGLDYKNPTGAEAYAVFKNL